MIGLNWTSSMKNILNKKTENFSIKKIDWTKVQLDMKQKLGNDIYESWLKKIDFILSWIRDSLFGALSAETITCEPLSIKALKV